jgi:lysophospholipase L1-like esterase
MKNKKNSASKSATAKRTVFIIILISLPILFFVVLEGVLRLVNYGGDLDLVLLRKAEGTKWYQINRDVARRYFTSDDFTIPEARGQVFAFRKTANTFRIFCLGESSTAGYPYQFNATFPSLLQDRLSLLFPNRDFEVINVGVSAISSFSVLDFVHELVHYQPDLFLIYMGHNEFYGALGAASTQRISRHRSVVRLYLQLEKLRLFHVLRNTIQWVGKKWSPVPAGNSDRTLMEMMVQDKMIMLGSPLYHQAEANFRANLEEILQTIKQHHTPVLVSTLVSNLADLEPFESQFSDGFKQKEQWSRFVELGQQAVSEKQFAAALRHYRQAAILDSMPAILHYRMGQCYEALGQYDDAQNAYGRSRDQDALRFRAAGDFNTVIAEVCAQQQTPIVDMEKAFADRSPHGLIGDELLLEHVHPNFQGYFVMADAFCRAMSKLPQLHLAIEWPWQRDLSEKQLLAYACVTEFDLAIGSERIRTLTNRYPFKHPRIIQLSNDAEYDRLLRETVQALQRKELGWNQAHYRVAEYLREMKRWPEAEQEYHAVIKITPNNYYPYIYLGDVLQVQNKTVEAENAFLMAQQFSPQLPYSYAKLGLLYMSRSQPQKAIEQLEIGVKLFGHVNDVTATEQAQARYLYAVALAQTQQFRAAQEQAEMACSLAPDKILYQQLLEQIRRTDGTR